LAYFAEKQRETQKRIVADPERLAHRRASVRERLTPERLREAYRRDSRTWMVGHAQVRARKAGVPCTIKRTDLFIPDRCPILGVLLVCGRGRNTGASPSLDRIDPTLGYVKGNVWIISHRANQIKNDATADELEAIARAIRLHGFRKRSHAWFLGAQ
jgi:hypothetical protein